MFDSIQKLPCGIFYYFLYKHYEIKTDRERRRKKEHRCIVKIIESGTVQCNNGYCYMTIFLAHRCTREVHFHFLGKIDFATGISATIIS